MRAASCPARLEMPIHITGIAAKPFPHQTGAIGLSETRIGLAISPVRHPAVMRRAQLGRREPAAILAITTFSSLYGPDTPFEVYFDGARQ